MRQNDHGNTNTEMEINFFLTPNLQVPIEILCKCLLVILYIICVIKLAICSPQFGILQILPMWKWNSCNISYIQIILYDLFNRGTLYWFINLHKLCCSTFKTTPTQYMLQNLRKLMKMMKIYYCWYLGVMESLGNVGLIIWLHS